MDAQRSLRLKRRLPFASLILLLIAAVIFPDRVWNTLLVGIGGLLAIAYVWARSLARGLHGRRRLRFGWMAVGDRLSEAFEVANTSPLPAIWVEVIDQGNVPGYRAGVVRSLEPSGTDKWRQSAVCSRRGQFRLGPWALETSDPFNIFRVTVRYPQADEIVIHPPIHTGIPVSLPAGQSRDQARTRERSWQATINAAGVREYQRRDPQNWIHWPTSARRGELFVRQFDLDTGGDIWLLIDLQAEIQLGAGTRGTEEHTVLLAAALAAQGLQENRAVGLAAYGVEPQIIPPGRGEGHLWRLLRALALMSADGQRGLASALHDFGRVARRDSAALILTASGSADWLPGLLELSRRGIRASIVLLDRASFGGGPNAGGSRGLQTALSRLGFASQLVRQGEVGRPIREGQAHGFWEFKVTRTGKVVTVRTPFER